MSLKSAVLAEMLAAMRTHESLLSIVNSVNMSIEATTLTEQFVARWTSVVVRFVRIVNSIDVVAKIVVVFESSQTMWTLRSIWSIENWFLALRMRRHR